MMPKGEDVTKGPARKNSGKDNDWYCEAISKL